MAYKPQHDAFPEMFLVGLGDAPLGSQFHFSTADVVRLLPGKERPVRGESMTPAAVLDRQTQILGRYLDLNHDGTPNDALREGPMVVQAVKDGCGQAGWPSESADACHYVSCTPASHVCSDSLREIRVGLGHGPTKKWVHHDIGCSGFPHAIAQMRDEFMVANYHNREYRVVMPVGNSPGRLMSSQELRDAYFGHKDERGEFARFGISMALFGTGYNGPVFSSKRPSSGVCLRVLYASTHTDSSILIVHQPAGGSDIPTQTSSLLEHTIRMYGKAVQAAYPRVMLENIAEMKSVWDSHVRPFTGREWCDGNGFDRLILHQPNVKLVRDFQKLIGLSEDRSPIIADQMGNMSAVTSPMTLYKLLQKGKIKAGDIIGMSGIGAGAGLNQAVAIFLCESV